MAVGTTVALKTPDTRTEFTEFMMDLSGRKPIFYSSLYLLFII